MPTRLKSRCPHCDAVVKVSETHVGKRVRCPSCKQPFDVSSIEAVLSDSASLDRTPPATETLASAPYGTPAESVPLPVSLSPPLAASAHLGRFLLNDLLGQG